MNLNWPLMRNNISPEDRKAAMGFIATGKYPALGEIGVEECPRLTNGDQVREFEREFAQWLGCKYAVMVNSGASANLITMMAVAQLYGKGRVAVPCITWSSDIMSIMHAGMTPVFVDILPTTLGLDWGRMPRVDSVFLTHCLGFDSFATRIPFYKLGDTFVEPWIIEDCCESIGATRYQRKLGTIGIASNFSFYYAHHMSTIEGGMICTDNEQFYQLCRTLRSHGLLRESDNAEFRRDVERSNPDLHPEFIFLSPSFNMRSTEINAVIGRSQLKRLDVSVKRRTENLLLFLSLLDADKYRTNYATEGSSNYALPLVLREKNDALMQRVLKCLRDHGVEYRRGIAGGGNQVRQPYLRHLNLNPRDYPEAEHVHFYGLYVGNIPDLEPEKVDILCAALNKL
jgi:CDP-6-deoxy-D-xylo-4-hexulose-3-dehydrase